MSSLFVSVLRQAFKTFDRSNQSAFAGNLTQLKQLVEQLTFCDMHLNQQELFSDSALNRPDHAPCTFVHIFENEIVSLSVFVMRSGYTMPLHDHPMMFGLLRGLYGQLRVQSYTQRLPANKPLVYDRSVCEIVAAAEEPRLISVDSGCGLLTPRDSNFHEITAVDGVAAFFDILSPPYNAEMPVYGSRRCRFYRSVPLDSELDAKPLVRLERIPAPLSYYCDTADTPPALVESTFVCCVDAYSSSGSGGSQ